jgi:hypothetical protein
MRDVEAAFHAHRKRHGIGDTKNGGLGLHLMVIVTSSFITDQGQLHDPNNPANQALFAESMAFARSVFGENSLYAARMDLDETGGGVVDLFLTPAAIDGRSKTLKIATSKFFTALRLKHRERMSYAALQTEWANWCNAHLSPAFERGKRKAVTRAEHLGVEEYRQARALAQLELDRMLDEAYEIRREAAADAALSAQDTATDYLMMTQTVEQDSAALEARRLCTEQGEEELRREQSALATDRTEVNHLTKELREGITVVRDMSLMLARLTLTVKEREAVGVMKSAIDQLLSLTSAVEPEC